MRNIKKDICKELAKHCRILNNAHKRADHSELERSCYYQRYIGEMEMLNRLSEKTKSHCRCEDIKDKGNKHIGHRMVKR